jgi:hypothetical protein
MMGVMMMPPGAHGSTEAEGRSAIYNIEQIDRGYQEIDKRLSRLGASIKRIVDRRKNIKTKVCN